MRADRLISIILLLQTNDKMTADELSQHLEVSTRTIYRDVLSLSAAGIPIYTDRGPGGGVSLLESYRTSLTGMNEDEARALFMLSIPNALVELGVGQNLKSALLKLSVALPPQQQSMQSHTQQRIYLDSMAWGEPVQPSAYLGAIHQAVWQDQWIKIIYQGVFDIRVELEVEPLGLVAKMNTWYLVGRHAGYLRVFKVEDIREVTILERGCTREESFNLAAFWTKWCTSTQARRPVYEVKLQIAPTLLTKLHHYLGEAIKFAILDDGASERQGWVEVSIQYEHFFQARESILNFGNAAIILEPEALRHSVIDYAQQIIHLYQAE